ncbi:hypothetical protein CWB41_12075 [Methylovirgula ligni]|uniref:Uncharacterized protein n=1 Tax=Methylovirgula ligni TaxID=569860 RepID=A0A3D9YWF9_9HYPH|nr:hypothetical protein [Methylovirgula ligni]QAY96375.1 hypothetical protein CWB41_12075 [Methylovirgula ligni]REF85903.1 hypothetical protein DES32_1942 [Methylovirgula ligni]
MDTITYFVALPFYRTEDGELVPGDAIECADAGRAVREAERLSRLNAGAIAFSRTGDPSLGEFNDATVIRYFGAVPEELLADQGDSGNA